MAHGHKKKRPQVISSNGSAPKKPGERSPKSMVIRIGAGEVGPSVTQLVKDLRLVLEPGTAGKLKERRKNKLRDYTTMAGPLGVTHLLLFSKSPSGNTNMRLAITPRGPTLHFRVENFSLSKDVLKSQRHPKSSKLLYINAPLLVMNNFASKPAGDGNAEPAVPKHLESLITTVFQSLFPALNPQTTPLPSIKRVLLLNRESLSDPTNGSYTITLRHYAISTRPTGLSRPMKRLSQASRSGKSEARGKGVPNLGRLEDVSEWLLDGDKGSYTSGSESEPDTDAEVEVLARVEKKIQSRDKKRRRVDEDDRRGAGVEKKAIKLAELGPRMRLRLIKVEEGLCAGKVLWHEFVQKSKGEEREMERVWEERRREKEERKRVQKENLERKRKEDAARKGEGNGEDKDDEKWDSDMLDAAEELDEEEQAREEEIDWEDEEEIEGEEEMRDVDEG